MLFRQIADDRLSQYAYLIGCQQTGEAVLVDPERDIDRYLRTAAEEDLVITAVVETHIHADFLSGARAFAEREDVRVYLSGEGNKSWKYEWARSEPYGVRFLHDGDAFAVGNVTLDVIHTPGHTPEHLSLKVTDGGTDVAMGILTGDFVFVGDLGRPDLLESAAGEQGAMVSSARRLYDSARTFLDLPDHLQVWPGHGAGSACGKNLGAVPHSTVGYERSHNDGLRAAQGDRDAFVQTILADQPEPPLYFGRMKTLNRDGVPLTSGRIEAAHLTVDDLRSLGDEVLLIDARKDRGEFMKRHARGAQFAPFGQTFPTVVGSLVENPETALVLVIDRSDVDAAVRSLLRIGFDRLEGYVEPSELSTYLDGGAPAGSIPEIDFAKAERLLDRGYQVVDVRYNWEFKAGHMPGAVHAPYTRLPERMGDLPRDRSLVVHCSAGIRSAPSASFLARRGWDVHYVDDEFERWAENRAAGMTT